MSKYLLKKDEERAYCAICKKSFIRKKGNKRKTCSNKCAIKLRSKTNRQKKGEE